MVEEDTDDTTTESGDSEILRCGETCSTENCTAPCALGYGHYGEHGCNIHNY